MDKNCGLGLTAGIFDQMGEKVGKNWVFGDFGFFFNLNFNSNMVGIWEVRDHFSTPRDPPRIPIKFFRFEKSVINQFFHINFFV